LAWETFKKILESVEERIGGNKRNIGLIYTKAEKGQDRGEIYARTETEKECRKNF